MAHENAPTHLPVDAVPVARQLDDHKFNRARLALDLTSIWNETSHIIVLLDHTVPILVHGDGDELSWIAVLELDAPVVAG